MIYSNAHRQYSIRTLAFMGGYAVLNIVALLGAFNHVNEPVAWMLGLAVSAPIAGQIWATLALMRDSDEFIRGLMARRFIIAAGVAMGGCCAWGFLETYAHASHAPGWLVYPFFWAAYGLISPFVRSTRP